MVTIINMQHVSENFSVLILAAGQSQRMGSPKAFLLWSDGKQTFIEKIVQEYMQAGIKNIFIVLQDKYLPLFNRLNSAIQFNTTLITNNEPEKGRIFSIRLGLTSIPINTNVFIQNVDNPFINSTILKRMMEIELTADYMQPICNSIKAHPVLLSKRAIDSVIIDTYCQNDLKSILTNYSVQAFEYHDEYLHININNLDDYNKWIKPLQ